MDWSRIAMATTVFLLLGEMLALGAVAQESSGVRSYRIGPRDKIQIHVAELPDLDTELEVEDDGTILLPVVGSIKAQGLTEDELALTIRARLESEGLRRATVRVRVTGYLSRPVSILGAVNNPGNHFIPGRATLLEVLMSAGGITREHDRVIHIRRRADNGLSDRVTIAVDDLIGRGDPAVNIPIFAGDIINIPEARQIRINILGEVGGSGTLNFRSTERVTLLAAIARAGGLTATASRKIRILRRQDGQEREITANFRRILSGKDPDVELEDGDIIVVKESFF